MTGSNRTPSFISSACLLFHHLSFPLSNKWFLMTLGAKVLQSNTVSSTGSLSQSGHRRSASRGSQHTAPARPPTLLHVLASKIFLLHASFTYPVHFHTPRGSYPMESGRERELMFKFDIHDFRKDVGRNIAFLCISAFCLLILRLCVEHTPSHSRPQTFVSTSSILTHFFVPVL